MRASKLLTRFCSDRWLLTDGMSRSPGTDAPPAERTALRGAVAQRGIDMIDCHGFLTPLVIRSTPGTSV